MLTEILKINRVPDGYGYMFVACFAGGITATLKAQDLRSYKAFQVGVLRKAAEVFVDEDWEVKGSVADRQFRWLKHIDALLTALPTKGTA